jgi:hypothetical protein
MTDPEEEPSREEAIYSIVFAFLKRHGFAIALIAPLGLISLVPMGSAGVLVVLVIYLGEAIVYSAIQRKGRSAPSDGIRSGPGPGLQALYVVLAALLIIGGLFGLGASDPSTSFAPIIAISLGVAIVAWVWYRIARGSREHTLIFLGRTGGILARTLAAAAASLAVLAVIQRIGLPVVIAIVVGVFAFVILVWWIVPRSVE